MKKGAKPTIFASDMFDGLTAEIVWMAAAAGITTGVIDFLSYDVAAAGTFILIFTFLLGLKLPRLAWLWAIMIGGAVPLVWQAALTGGYLPADPFSDAVSATVAVGPAIVGAYLGALTRHVGDHLKEFRKAPAKRRSR